jgi:hypothetical protein
LDKAQPPSNSSALRGAVRLGVIFSLLAVLPACSSKKGGGPQDAGTGDDPGAPDSGVPDPDAGHVGDYVRPIPVTIPPALPPPDFSNHPKDSLGRPIISRGPRLYLTVRAPDALTALAACTSMITRCVHPPERSLDACVISTPRCTTSQPWQEPECCAESCVTAYEARRRAGVNPILAFDQTFYGPSICMPGVDELKGGN